ncbi:hormogonium polysaccharide biosynthesis glycosyltransferase HpsO [Leptothoe kymatousa]|uniref:Glycosyltransferase family 4 protein n=1 Tax=Leptothoe kymatousa TAU-MAC 1615 TaxID=2364775 RepID=A0ABS5Y5B4_9CYAN|nr:hormogonium polysaccharide biosynthesis glycosyltransferase HpsO [Leptothoe kymatousa]MBT9312826.1 glycosyltransferase family 4 protein [Leptothoe kymatousa TAU-MAC 1615]
MKVLVASHSYIVELNCEKLRTLAHMGHDVTVVVPKRWNPGGVQNRIVEPEPRQDGSFRVVPISNLSQNNQGLLSFGWDIVPLLKAFQPDIIQVEQGSKSLGYAELITLNRLLGGNAKNLFFTWWNLPYELKFPLSLLEAYNLNNTDGLVVGNQDGADILKQRGYHGPVRVMPQLGVDERLFRPTPQPQLRQQLSIAEGEFIIGFVGRFVPEKGLLTLFKALATLVNLPWTLVLLGRGPLKEELQNQADALNISDRIRWIESVPHDAVPDYINLMDTLVLPSETTYEFKTLTSVGWKEQFGHVLIEAMACQVPVIGSDSGEIPHVIDDSGLVFPEGDHGALADRLTQVIKQPEQQQALAQKGYARAMKHYTNKALATELLGFYQELLTS